MTGPRLLLAITFAVGLMCAALLEREVLLASRFDAGVLSHR